MFQTLKNAWKIPDLRRKILFTICIVLVYRIGAVLPVPYISADSLNIFMSQTEGSIFQYLNILSGDAFGKATLFALAVSPYITAQIVMQLLAIAIPALERLSKDGDEGREKINRITRYVSVGIAVITAFGYYMYMKRMGMIVSNNVVPEWFEATVVIACYVAGSALIMWMSEKINERGIGNGISVILFVNILASLPNFMIGLVRDMLEGWKGVIYGAVVIVIGLGLLVFIVFMSESERRLPIQYAKKVVGRKMYGGQNTTLPIKINMSGVMPIIFANSILMLPSTIAAFFKQPASDSFWGKFLKFISYESWFYVALFVILIIAFSYFYIAISFNPVEVANNLKKNGGFIPGIRPGKPTSDYITKVLNKIILIGAIMLCVIAALPLIINIVVPEGISSLAFGGSSIIIVVGVALELYRAVEAEMTMRHYRGFLG